jgi:hypothetical protein
MKVRPMGAAQDEALARPSITAHIWAMAGRPCNPDSDLKRLWQTLLPGTPFPQCGARSEPGTAVRDDALLADKQTADERNPAAADRDV